MTWSTGIGDHSGEIGATIGTLIIVGGIILGMRACSYSECGEICRSNGDAPDWTWTQGCYCRDKDGVYNPKDSRERRSAP
jgi:hypothetical protein